MRLSVVAGILVATSQLGAQGIVRGTVTTEQGQRVAGVELAVPALNKTVRSDSTGAYKFVLPAGTYRMTIRALGFFSISDDVEPEDNVELIKDWELTSTAKLLDNVTTTAARKEYISPRLRDFEERRNMHLGRYIAEAEFRMNEDRLFSDMLKRVPGVYVMPGRGSEFLAVATRSQGSTGRKGAILGAQGASRSSCYVTIYVDGVLMYDQGTIPEVPGLPRQLMLPPDLNTFRNAELAGVEYYASNSAAPVQYRDRSGCGLLLLWTRER